MKWGAHITKSVAVATLATVMVAPSIGVAQKTAPHPAPQRQGPPPQQHSSRPAAAAPHTAVPQPRHIGDWLRRYKDLAPDEVERELKDDRAFQQLPPKQQQLYRRRLEYFSSLPPDKQLKMLNRQDTFEHLTPEQQQQVRQTFGQMRQLPPDRRRLVHKAIDDLRAMPPDQRESIIDSDRFKGIFSDQERELMRGAMRLPLAPADSGDQPGQPEE